MRRIVSTVALSLTIVLALSIPAAAANKFPLTLNCGSTSYDVTVAGNGDWAPARDNNSTLVFHPTAFGEFTGTFTPADPSQPPETFTDPPFARKTQPRNGHPTFDCTYDVHFDEGDGTFDGHGSVSGFTTGTRRG